MAATSNSTTIMSSDQIACEYDAIFAACQTEAELESVVRGIDFEPMSGSLVACITDSYENAIIRIRSAMLTSLPVEVSYCPIARLYWLRWDNGRAATCVSLLSVAIGVVHSLNGQYRRAYPIFRYYDAG